MNRLLPFHLPKKIRNMNKKTYLILLVDRKRTKMFTLIDGAVEDKADFDDDQVPKKVKHGNDTWDSQDKIFRHIEEHLHRHLLLVGQHVAEFGRKNHISEIIIGSHKPLFAKIEKHLPYPFCHKVKGRFVTELKAPFNEILHRALQSIDQIEANTT